MKNNILILITLLMVSCHQYPAQKKPWPVGTTPLYFHGIKVDYAEPLTVKSYQVDDFNDYDGSYHVFYVVTDKNGRNFEHVIDYQLSTHK